MVGNKKIQENLGYTRLSYLFSKGKERNVDLSGAVLSFLPSFFLCIRGIAALLIKFSLYSVQQLGKFKVKNKKGKEENTKYGVWCSFSFFNNILKK